MSALLIAEMTVSDAAKMAEYRRQVGPVIAKFGGRVLGVDGAPTPLEGDWRPENIVVVEFPDKDAIRNFLDSAEYQPLAALRRSAAETDSVGVKGVA
jgi:uncharacterized protein (DUF1330 family)